MKEKNKVLIIGSGGREHAIGWKLSQSSFVEKIFFAPGNAGTELLGENIPISVDQLKELLAFAKKNSIDLTVVGPEIPLVLGITDLFESENLKIFGPSKFCAQLEGSKSFSKSFMKKYNIPTAGYEVFTKDNLSDLITYLEEGEFPIVLKADGLAAGKGVIIPDNLPDALDAVKEYFIDQTFGDAGHTVVVEEFMHGEEASIFVLTDGKNYRLFPAAQDHKRIGENDTGKNTGGMGAYAPAPVVTSSLLGLIEREIVTPSLNGMISEGHPYRGILYIGLMITENGPKVVEYNCRFGDPECQIEMALTASDLFPLLLEAANYNLTSELEIKNGYAADVVLSANGYPDKYEKGKLLDFRSPDTEDQFIFHAGTVKKGNQIFTNGGRVLNIVGYGKTLQESLDKAYSHISSVSFEGMYFRKDIGKKGLK